VHRCGRLPKAEARERLLRENFAAHCIATGLVRGNVGLGDFTDAAVKDERVLAVASEGAHIASIRRILIRTNSPATSRALADGTVVEERQPTSVVEQKSRSHGRYL